MEKKEGKKMKAAIAIIALIVLAGCIEQTQPEQECPACLCESEKAQLADSREFYKSQLEQKQEELDDLKEMGTDLWDDYYYCYIAFICWGEENKCKQELDFTQENLEYAFAKCNLADNYQEYFETFEEEIE